MWALAVFAVAHRRCVGPDRPFPIHPALLIPAVTPTLLALGESPCLKSDWVREELSGQILEFSRPPCPAEPGDWKSTLAFVRFCRCEHLPKMSSSHKTTIHELIGKYVLFGITRVSHEGEITGEEQHHGYVESMDSDGIRIRLEPSGRAFRVPPEPTAFEPAEPGEYRLRSTGEVVVNPDFVARWTVQAPPPDWTPEHESL